jgi:hypothetical protein
MGFPRHAWPNSGDNLFEAIDEDAALAVLDAEESKFTLTQSQAPPRPAPSVQPPPPKRLKTSTEPQGWVASTTSGVKRQASLNDYDDLDVSVRSNGTYAINGARPLAASRVPGPVINMGAPAQRTTPALAPGREGENVTICNPRHHRDLRVGWSVQLLDTEYSALNTP